jgi:MFS transporter, DHA1 family, solute carrier family 18 (vesicular amine transporter), member 1/2
VRFVDGIDDLALTSESRQVVGPPAGGALYSRFGFRGPIIFGIIVTFLDLVGRLLVIERHEALQWGIDPTILPEPKNKESNNGASLTTVTPNETEKQEPSTSGPTQDAADPATSERIDQTMNTQETVDAQENTENTNTVLEPSQIQPISLVRVLKKLLTSPRALVPVFLSLVYGIVVGTQEPTIPLQLERIWGLDSAKVGLVFLAAVVPTVVCRCHIDKLFTWVGAHSNI